MGRLGPPVPAGRDLQNQGKLNSFSAAEIFSQPVINFRHAKINTAGAFVSIAGYYPFALGSILHNGRIPVYRLGGHRQENETGWECAMREVFEETKLNITPLVPDTTYQMDENGAEFELGEIEWLPETLSEPIPILVRSGRQENQTLLSLMYLAQADSLPIPSNEVKGLLLLDEGNIHELCQRSLTLEQYLENGGQAILKDAFDEHLILEPFVQLRALSKIMKLSTLTRKVI